MRSRCLILICLLLLSAARPAAAQERWVLRWSDEFSGPVGNPPNSAIWTMEEGAHGFGGEELQAYTARPQNVSLDGHGNLVITALEESYGPVGYTSGRIHTRGKKEFRYGAIEIRAKLPSGYGVGAAAWTCCFGKGVAWPGCGERDIWEVFGADASRVVSSLVASSKLNEAVPVGQSESYYFPKGQDVTDWHVYRHEYVPARGKEPEEMRFYVDGTLYRRAKPEWFPGVWTFDRYNHFLLLNIAIGGDRPWGRPVPTTTFPQQMVVDYVRFYSYEAMPEQ